MQTVEVAESIQRIVADSPGTVSYSGTKTYIIHSSDEGTASDPGPVEDHDHFEAIIEILGPSPAGRQHARLLCPPTAADRAY
ncbi:hypothetical protein [Roseobacter litoralis]|uniref:hypothetical protein n=1 Tax=Roseobacter litoralis TaxID=42443 RepID=UPI002494BCA2|nr:hypothetical protein [Roseobacter litoralis]